MSCQVCNKQTKTQKCSGCLTGAYCSKECQSKHWLTHKDKCPKLKMFLDVKLCGKKVKKNFKIVRKHFSVFDPLPDILCDVNTWKTYNGCIFDLVMLSELHLRNDMNPEKYTGKGRLYRQLLQIGKTNMIEFLKGDRKVKKCFSRDDTKSKVIRIGRKMHGVTHQPGECGCDFMRWIFDHGLLCFPEWARKEIYSLWKNWGL